MQGIWIDIIYTNSECVAHDFMVLHGCFSDEKIVHHKPFAWMNAKFEFFSLQLKAILLYK